MTNDGMYVAYNRPGQICFNQRMTSIINTKYDYPETVRVKVNEDDRILHLMFSKTDGTRWMSYYGNGTGLRFSWLVGRELNDFAFGRYHDLSFKSDELEVRY